jgi:hypothetical protein
MWRTYQGLGKRPIKVDRRGDSKSAYKVATELAPFLRRSQKDMCCNGFSVYLENHLNLIIALPIYLTVSSLIGFRSLCVVEKLGDKILGS